MHPRQGVSMSIFTTSGYHYISNKEGTRFYPIMVGFKMASNQTIRHTLALKNLPVESSIDGCIDTWNTEIRELRQDGEGISENLTNEQVAEWFEGQKTFKLRVWTPKQNVKGKVISGICVGGHVDYRTSTTPKGKIYGKPHMLWQLAFLGDGNKVTFVTVKKEAMDTLKSLPDNISAAYDRMCDAYPAGGEISCRVVPQRDRYRLHMESYTPPKSFIETMVEGVMEDLSVSSDPPLSGQQIAEALNKMPWINEIRK